MPLLQVGQSTGQQYDFWGQFWVGMTANLPGALLGLLWLVLVVVLLLRFRAQLSRAIALLLKRVEEGAPVSAVGIEVGAAPGIISTGALPDGRDMPDDEGDFEEAVGPDDIQDFGAWKRANTGLLARHLDLPTLVVAGPSPYGQPRTGRSMGTLDAFTVANLHASLGGAFGTSTSATVVETVERARELLRTESSIVSVGGPVSNPLTPLLMDACNVPIRFDRGGLFAPSLGEVWTPERTERQEVVKDFVLAFGGPHRHRDEGWCTVLASVAGAGTPHAARFLQATKPEDILEGEDIASGYLLVLEVILPSASEDRCGFHLRHVAPLGVSVSGIRDA